MRALAVAAGFAFAISLASSGRPCSWPGRTAPAPGLIYRYQGRPGELNAAQAYALAVILMAVTVACVFLVERLRGRARGWL